MRISVTPFSGKICIILRFLESTSLDKNLLFIAITSDSLETSQYASSPLHVHNNLNCTIPAYFQTACRPGKDSNLGSDTLQKLSILEEGLNNLKNNDIQIPLHDIFSLLTFTF